jgi:hypothetical protein
MSKMIGRIAFKLLANSCKEEGKDQKGDKIEKSGPVVAPTTLIKLRETLIGYFQFICEHESDLIRLNACYNLPGFHFLFRKTISK